MSIPLLTGFWPAYVSFFGRGVGSAFALVGGPMSFFFLTGGGTGVIILLLISFAREH